jgi:hypothetical protein
MSREAIFLYMFFLSADYKLYVGGNTLDNAIINLEDIASTSSNATTIMWAQNVSKFIRQYKV